MTRGRPFSGRARPVKIPDVSDMAILVRSLREHLGLTQEESAHRLGVSFSTVNVWENGLRQPLPFLQRRLLEMAEAEGLLLQPDHRTGRRWRTDGGQR